ncbi:hypothetical protein BZG36_01884 [Bifiguratus adelaidae]|uniref:Uncharacterized protein n=1 Tax=Bifiguratus adelaidae TaxID=1938954 RepID=A0A261Y4C8_9FUNG|nr:hypothetical protein BZG36_01884 [Bifiguratus adelaidae]
MLRRSRVSLLLSVVHIARGSGGKVGQHAPSCACATASKNAHWLGQALHTTRLVKEDVVEVRQRAHAILSTATLENVTGSEVRSVLEGLRNSGSVSDLFMQKQILNKVHPYVSDAAKANDYQSLMRGLLRKQQTVAALELLSDMKQQNINPGVIMYNILVQHFRKQGNYHQVEALFADMKQMGIEPDQFTYNQLIKMYCDKQELGGAYQIYQDLLRARVKPNSHIYNALLSGCLVAGDQRLGVSLIHNIRASKTRIDTLLLNSIVKFLGTVTNDFDAAFEAYQELPARFTDAQPDIITYNIMLDLVRRFQRNDKKAMILSEIHETGLKPTQHTLHILLKDEMQSGHVDNVTKLLRDMDQQGVPVDDKILNDVMTYLCEQTAFSTAFQLWDEIGWKIHYEPNGRTYHAMFASFAKAGDSDMAEKLFHRLFEQRKPLTNQKNDKPKQSKPTTSIYTNLMLAYIRAGKPQSAMKVYYSIQDSLFTDSPIVPVDSIFYSSLIQAFSKSAQNTSLSREEQNKEMSTALQIFTDMRNRKLPVDKTIYTQLLSTAGKLGDAEIVRQLHKLIKVDMSLDPDISIYNAIMNAYNWTGQQSEVIDVWETIQFSGLEMQIDQASVSIVLDACGHNNMGYKAKAIWNELRRQQFPLHRNNWTSYVEALCRMGPKSWSSAQLLVKDRMIREVGLDKKTVQTLLSFARKYNLDDTATASVRQMVVDAFDEVTAEEWVKRDDAL